MAITVEDGTGKADADSYLSVADADTYHTNHSNSSDWSGATTDAKERALRIATQYLDARYNSQWRGYKKTTTQALAWPRQNVVDEDGRVVDADSVPSKVADATAEMALREVQQTDALLVDVSAPSGSIIRKKEKVGPIEEETEYTAGSTQKQYTLVDFMLRHLTGRSWRVRRA